MTEVLVSSTVLILALAALRWLLRGKIDPRLQYALWLLAALRLLLPVPLVSSPVSVMNAAADVPAAVQRLTAPEDRRAPQPAAEAAAAQPAAAAEPQAQTKEKLPVRTILKTVWLTGAAILAGVMLAQNLRFLRKLRRVRQPLACAESPIPVWLVPGDRRFFPQCGQFSPSLRPRRLPQKGQRQSARYTSAYPPAKQAVNRKYTGFDTPQPIKRLASVSASSTKSRTLTVFRCMKKPPYPLASRDHVASAFFCLYYSTLSENCLLFFVIFVHVVSATPGCSARRSSP